MDINSLNTAKTGPKKKNTCGHMSKVFAEPAAPQGAFHRYIQNIKWGFYVKEIVNYF